MKIEKLPSGSYRVRKMYQGKTYSVVFDGKPTQKEALKAISDELDKVRNAYTKMTFQKAAEEYCDSKRNVLSPKTIKEYVKMIKQFPDWFCRIRIEDITQLDINRLVNEISKTRSPKTVRNYHGLVSAVLSTFRPDMKIYTKLPQKVKNEPYTPSQGDIRAILSESSGTMYEVPILLACYGMRRSEICALTLDDIDGDVVHINKALVQDEQNNWIVKTTKTTESTRDIIIPMEIADKIREQGYVYNGYPNSITCYLSRIEKKLNIPHFSIHKLRHYFASQMSAIGIPESDILRLGGWETDYVMKSVYRHSMMEKENDSKRIASERLKQTIFS